MPYESLKTETGRKHKDDMFKFYVCVSVFKNRKRNTHMHTRIRNTEARLREDIPEKKENGKSDVATGKKTEFVDRQNESEIEERRRGTKAVQISCNRQQKQESSKDNE